MPKADWDERFRRTAFYEVYSRKEGFNARRYLPMYLVSIVGANFPPLIEPGDANLVGGVSAGLGTTGMAVEFWKHDDEKEIGTYMKNILEDWKTGEEKPTPLHRPAWGWPA